MDANFLLTLKNGKVIPVNAESQKEAMDYYKREINPEAEIVSCEWVNPKY